MRADFLAEAGRMCLGELGRAVEVAGRNFLDELSWMRSKSFVIYLAEGFWASLEILGRAFDLAHPKSPL